MTTANVGIRSGNTIAAYTAGSTMPAGTIISYSGSIAAFTSTASADSTTLIHKDGWAVCNGASIARATYADLYARVAATWNASTNPLTGSAQAAPADAATNFRIPNLQGAFLRGVGDFADNTKDTTLAGFQDQKTAKNGLALSDPGHDHDIRMFNYGGTLDNYLGGANRDAGSSSQLKTVTDGSSGIVANTTGISLAGDSETRPQNVGVYYLVKLYDNLAAVDIYIPPASAGIAGLVNNVAGNTAGTPILGKTDGVAVAGGYVGEKITWTSAPSTQSLSTSDSDWINATFTLTPGIWLIQYHIQYSLGVGASGDVSLDLYLRDSSGNLIQTANQQPRWAQAGAGTLFSVASCSVVESPSVSKTYKITARYRNNAGTNSASLLNAVGGYSQFFAVRIA